MHNSYAKKNFNSWKKCFRLTVYRKPSFHYLHVLKYLVYLN